MYCRLPPGPDLVPPHSTRRARAASQASTPGTRAVGPAPAPDEIRVQCVPSKAHRSLNSRCLVEPPKSSTRCPVSSHAARCPERAKGAVGAVTVIAALPCLPSDEAVTVALPSATAVTSPVPSTVAIDVLEDSQLMLRPLSALPLASRADADSRRVVPLSTLAVAGVTT